MSVAIERGGAKLIGELEPLWLALVAHHHASAPHLGPVREPEDTWARRRASYEKWLAEPDAFVLVARDEATGRAVGYAMVVIDTPGPTWPNPERRAEVETLALLPEARGAGLGHALLERVQEEVAPLGIEDLHLTAIAANESALRFYEREGFRPMLIGLHRTPRTR